MRSCLSLASIMYAGLAVATFDMFIFHRSVTDGWGLPEIACHVIGARCMTKQVQV
jgi:hypothetical protein